MTERNDKGETRAPGPASGGETRARPRMARWKKALLAASVALMAVGLGLQAYGYVRGGGDPPAAAPKPRSAPPPAMSIKGFAPDPPPAPAPTGEADEPIPADRVEDWYPAVFRLGFSFFVGFCIAYALRMFFRISIVAIGLVLLVLVGLQYAGVIQIDWTAMQGHYDVVARWLGEQTASLRQLVTGYLPSSASAAAGLVLGFRRG